MGLFSSKKKTYVSSSVWNMAGDIKDRANYLKTTVVGNILLDSPKSLGESIPNSYLNGPGMGLRRYAKWARGPSNYDGSVGYVGGGITFGDSLDPDVLKTFLTVGPNEYLILNEYDIGLADSDWWAEEFMLINHQDLLFTDWFSELQDNGDILITYEDTTTETFTPVGFDAKKRYLYCLYQAIAGGVTGDLTPGAVTVVPDEASFPPVPVDYVQYSDTDVLTPGEFQVNTVTDITYSDGRPAEHTDVDSVVPVDLVTNTVVYHKYTLNDHDTSNRDMYIQTRDEFVVPGSPVTTTVTEDIGGGVTKTTVTVVTSEKTDLHYSYHNDPQIVSNDQVSEFRYFRYQELTGNATLDAMFSVPNPTTQFLPYIPIRINNTFVRDLDANLYKQTKRAYAKATSGAKLNKLVRKVEDNPQLGDLDYIYAVYGTSLNSPEMTARQYMFEFFDKMASSNIESYSKFVQWQNRWAAAAASMDAYEAWVRQYKTSSSGGGGNSNQGGSSGSSGANIPPPPVIIPYPSIPVLSIDMRSTTEWMNFHMSIQFNGVRKISGAGILAGHKAGDYWITNEAPSNYTKKMVNYSSGGSGSGNSNNYQYTNTQTIVVEKQVIYHQVSATNWEAIELHGMVHNNYVYDGKWVVIKGSEAMADPEESGFIIPLHEETFREMRLVDSTQLASACCYLVFNCYKVVKKKWYQSGFFKFLLVVVIIVVSIVFAPAGAGATGVLGSSAAVGGAMGFAGTAAIVAGTIANAVAAMIITKALTTAFGDKLGPILGTMVTIALTAYGGVGGGGNLDMGSMMTELSKVDNILAITDSLVKSVSSYMADKTQAIYAETERMMAEHKKDMLAVAKQYEEMFGGAHGVIDPIAYSNSGSSSSAESRGAFIERTLMCGSDVAKMSQDLVRNFSDITLNLDLPM